MSKYTEDQINEALEIVQAALNDAEIEYKDYVRTWVTADSVGTDSEHRAKKKPREWYYCWNDGDSYAVQSRPPMPGVWQHVAKVREVLE